jgi:hypothetical protein
LIFKNCWSCTVRMQRRRVHLFQEVISRNRKFKRVCRVCIE